MPLAHTPFRPQAEVELLGTKAITVEQAVQGLEASVLNDCQGSGLPVTQSRSKVTGSTLVNYLQIPRIVESLRTEWASLPAEQRPGCFVQVRGRLEAHLHPCFMGPRLMEGLRAQVGGLLLRFSETLKCVPLGFKELKPAGSHGALVAESPYVHFLIEFSAIGFVPKVGQRLLVKINDVQSAIGANLMFLENFNFFVPKARLPQGVFWDEQAGRWMVEDGNGGARKYFSKKRPVWVKVTKRVVETSSHHPLSLVGEVDGATGADAPPPEGEGKAGAKRKNEKSAKRAASTAGLDHPPAAPGSGKKKRKSAVADPA